MSSGSTSDVRGDDPDYRPTTEAIETQLHAALDGTETRETRYHLRQALQLVEGFDDPE